MKFLFWLFLFPITLFGQQVVEQTAGIPVLDINGNSLAFPWTGGINAAQISTLDADYDGLEDDIFLFDKAGNRILIFIGSEVDGERTYTFDPKISDAFPPVRAWALLRDADCDGDKDLISYASIGGAAEYWENVGNPSTGLQYNLQLNSISSWYQFNANTGFNIGVFISSQDIPALFDFEGDGDLDMLTFSVSGRRLEFHFNESMEAFGECRMDTFRLASNCYGRILEGSEDNEIIQDFELVDDACFGDIPDPLLIDDRLPAQSYNGSPRHVGSTLLAFNGSGDELPDIVIGDVTFTNLSYLENSDRPDPLVDSIIDVTTDFPANFGAEAVDIDNFPSAFYEDVNGDGVRDLLVSVNDPNLSANKESLWLYENLGEEEDPIFSLLQKNFLQDQTIDFGEATSPAFFDYNQDGLIDMVAGARGEYQGTASFSPVIALFINNGTITEPSFQLIDDNWLNISSLAGNQLVRPTFGDLDDDGDDDLLVGIGTGELLFYENQGGTVGNASFGEPEFIEVDGLTLDVGQNSAPQLFDLNGDGLLDLIIGERNGNLNYYENSGSAQSAEFSFITDTLGGVSSIVPNFFIGNATPHFYVFQDELWLAMGNEAGLVSLHKPNESDLSQDFELIDNEAFGIKAGLLSSPVSVDLNGDMIPEIITGSVGGGLQFYEGTGVVSDQFEPALKPEFSIYPNPATTVVSISDLSLEEGSSAFVIYSMLGQIVSQGNLNRNQIDVAGLFTGVYILIITNGNQVLRSRFVKK
jgi:hypothetical protein